MQRLCFARLFYLQPKYAGQFLHSFIKCPVALITIIGQMIPFMSCVMSKTCGLFQYWMRPLALWRRRPRVSSIRPVNSWEWPSSVWVTVALWKRWRSMTFSHSLKQHGKHYCMACTYFFVFFKQHHDIMLRLCGGGQWELTKLKEAWTFKLTHHNEKILVRFVVMSAFSLETLEKSCLLDSILRFTEVTDTLIMSLFAIVCLNVLFIKQYIIFIMQVYAASVNFIGCFLPNGCAQKRDFYNEGHLRVFQE